VDITARGDFLGLCDKKNHIKHVSDFGRLQSYGHFFNSRTRPRVNLVLRDQLAGGLSFALQALVLQPDSPTQLQTVLCPYLDTSNVFKECGEGGVGGLFVWPMYTA
jgi:hypothetical protein